MSQVNHIVFLLEERSAKNLLEIILPKLLPEGVSYRIIPFEGKQDLEKGMVRKIRGYNIPRSHFVVLRDQDSGDCLAIKARLAKKCVEAGKSNALIRIACRELESWYLADLQAVEKGLEIKNLSLKQEKKIFRDPDKIGSPSKELSRLTDGQYLKLQGTRKIAPYLDLTNRRSSSFAAFIDGIKRLLNSLQPVDS